MVRLTPSVLGGRAGEGGMGLSIFGEVAEAAWEGSLRKVCSRGRRTSEAAGPSWQVV